MFIAGLGVATPAQRYSQADCWEALQSSGKLNTLNPRSRALLKKVLLGNNGILHRHLALDSLAEALDLSPDALHARFREHAPRLASEAALQALSQAGLAPADID